MLKKKFRLVSGIKIKVKDLVYSDKVMLIKFDIVPDDDDPQEMTVTLTADETNNCYTVTKVDDPNLFIF